MIDLRRELTPRLGVSLAVGVSQRTDRTEFTETLSTHLGPGQRVDQRTVRVHARHREFVTGLVLDYRLVNLGSWSTYGRVGVHRAFATDFGGSRIAEPGPPGGATVLTDESPYDEISHWRFPLSLRGERSLGRSLQVLADVRGVLGARYRLVDAEASAPTAERGFELGGGIGIGYRF